MSADNVTSILLPAAQVDVFASDDGTAAILRMLAADWRFSRVRFNIERAGITEAIARYQNSPTPALVILETDDIGDSFIKQLTTLASFCSADTDAIVIGPKNDVHLYRSLVEMGVKDYLVRPVAEDEIVKVVARTLVDKKGTADSRLIAVIGSKGGVGTTTVAQLLAWDIAEGLEQKTVLMDVAGSAGSLGLSFGLEPTLTLSEAIRIGDSGSEDDLKRLFQVVTGNLSICLFGGEPTLMESPAPDGVEKLINRVMQKNPVVVMDLSNANRSVQRRMLERAAGIVIVTAPLLPALRNARMLIGELKLLKAGLQGVSLVVNMKGLSGGEEIPPKDIQVALDMEPMAYIPYMPKVFVASEAEGHPAAKSKDISKVMENLLRIAEKEVPTAKRQQGTGEEKSSLMGSLAKIFGK